MAQEGTAVVRRVLFACLVVACADWRETARAQTIPSPESPPPTIQMGISADIIPVSSDFAGTHIAVFGTIENADKVAQLLNEYSIVVTIAGPLQNVVVRRKERVLGIWINREARVYRAVPSFYALASNRPLEAIADTATLKADRIGIENLALNLFSTGDQTFALPAPEFSGALRRIRANRDLYTEDTEGVGFLGSTLFRASLPVPSNAPIGEYTVSAFLFRNGGLLASRSGGFRVERAGFESSMYTLAHVYSYWYGIIAVAAALATGWLASIIFGRN